MATNYRRAAEVATALLLRQHLYSLRIDVTRLSYDRPVLFDSMQHFCTMTNTTLAHLTEGTDCLRDGCTLIRRRGGRNFYIVLYNEDSPNTGRRGFTLAHEVGHIYLGHLEDGDVQEQEANCFAAQLLAPEILVRELARQSACPLTACDISDVFAVSHQAAENRINGLMRFPRRWHTHDDRMLLKRMRHLLPEAGSPVVDI